MGWTNPRTWNPGETVTATIMNTHVRDNLNVLKTAVTDDGYPIANSILHTDFTQYANSGVAETDLATLVLPANTFDVDGKGVEVAGWGLYADTANEKVLYMYFGATAYIAWQAAWRNCGWKATMLVFRSAEDNQRIQVHATWRSTSDGVSRVYDVGAAQTEDDGAAITIKFAAKSLAASNDILQYGFVVTTLQGV